MNTPVNFNLGKLLNSKGLPGLKSFYDNQKHYEQNPKKYTIAEVIMWLYKKYGIWIANNWQVGRQTFLYELIDVSSYENTILIQEKNYKDVGEVEFNSPTEAYEAAIEYVLKNLI